MSTSTYVTCAGCGKPIEDACFIWTGTGMYHNHCRPAGGVNVGPPVLLAPQQPFKVEQAERDAIKEIIAGLAFICEISDTGQLVDHTLNDLERRRNAGVMAAHTDHPMRHYDRTCPACNPPGVKVDAVPQRFRWDQDDEDSTSGFMVGPVPDGEWVRWRDVAHLYGVNPCDGGGNG